MKKKDNNQKTIGILAAAIILNMALAGAYVYAFNAVKVKNEQASLVSAELNEYLSKEGTINLLKKTVKDTDGDRKKMEGYFVGRDDIPKFTKDIEALGEMSGAELTITDLRTQENVLSFDISSRGSFPDIMHLISLFEFLPFKVEVTKAYINRVEKDKGAWEWEGKFTIELTGYIGK